MFTGHEGFKELLVMKDTIGSYADIKKREFELYEKKLHKIFNFLDVNNYDIEEKINLILNYAETLSAIFNSYKKARKIGGILLEIIVDYTNAKTPEEGAKVLGRFYEIKNQNSQYKMIVDELAYILYTDPKHNYIFNGLEMGYEAKLASLEEDLKSYKIIEKELIAFANLCWHLSQNPEYIKQTQKNGLANK